MHKALIVLCFFCLSGPIAAQSEEPDINICFFLEGLAEAHRQNIIRVFTGREAELERMFLFVTLVHQQNYCKINNWPEILAISDRLKTTLWLPPSS